MSHKARILPRSQRKEQRLKQFTNELLLLGRKYGTAAVYRDFCEFSAYALSNALDPDKARVAKREANYFRLMSSYGELAERLRFPEMFAILTLALDDEYQDFLGSAMDRLEIADAGMAQILTPYSMAQLMAKLTLIDAPAMIEEHGFLTLLEPACGTGVMVIAAAEELLNQGINFQRDLHVTCIDTDPRMAWAAYVQLSLLGVPATVHIGNSLSDEMRETFHTPMHHMRGWSAKLRGRTEREADAAAGAAPPEEVELPILLPDELPLAAD